MLPMTKNQDLLIEDNLQRECRLISLVTSEIVTEKNTQVSVYVFKSFFPHPNTL